MTQALIYVRQSRHKDYERTASPEVQRQACLDLGAVKGCDQVDVLEDLDVSGGKTKGRVAYQQLLERIRAGSVDVVAFFDQSRAFRNTADALDFYALMEKHPSIEVAFVHGSFERSAVGEFSYSVLAAAHAMERRMTGEKIKATYRALNAKGAATGMPPYGYSRDSEARLVIDEDQATVVRRIFADYATGAWSARALARRLSDEGVPRDPARSRSGLGWLPDTVVDVLRNVAYAGMTYSVSRARREGNIIPAEWPAIIDRRTFDRVQILLDQNKHLAGKAMGRQSGASRDYAFGGLLVCADCGHGLRATFNHGAVYYYCRRDVGQPCSNKAIREERLLPWATYLFDQLEALQPADLAQALAEGRQGGRVNVDAVAQVDRALERIGKRYEWGHVDDERYLAETGRLQELRDELLAATTPEAPTVTLAGVGQAWRSGDAVTRRALFTTFFERLYVRDGAISSYVPRSDRREEVMALIQQATGGAAEVEEVDVRKPGRPRRVVARCGKGGIRTLEGVSHPLPA